MGFRWVGEPDMEEEERKRTEVRTEHRNAIIKNNFVFPESVSSDLP